MNDSLENRSEHLRDLIGKEVTVTVDRPLGSSHPDHRDTVYPVNYGYIEGLAAADGEEQDAYILGQYVPLSSFSGIVAAVIVRKDDLEDKLVVVPKGMTFSKEEIEKLTRFQEQFFDSEVIM